MNESGMYPISYKAYKKALKQLEKDEVAKISAEVTQSVINAYAPPSTRWHRNHTAIAEWYFIWHMQQKVNVIHG